MGSSKPKASFDNRVIRIRKKAAKLFAQNGYPHTSMIQIAKAANLQKGGLYHYVESKEILLFEILDRTLDIFQEGADNLNLDGLSPEEKFKCLLHEYVTTLVRYHSEITLVVLASRYLRPKLRKIIQEKRARYENLFYSIISEGLSNNTFAKHDGKETIGFLVFGAVFNFYLWNPTELKGDVEKKIEGFGNFFLRGLLKR